MKFHQYFPSVLLGSTAGWLLTFAIGFYLYGSSGYTGISVLRILIVHLVWRAVEEWAFQGDSIEKSALSTTLSAVAAGGWYLPLLFFPALGIVDVPENQLFFMFCGSSAVTFLICYWLFVVQQHLDSDQTNEPDERYRSPIGIFFAAPFNAVLNTFFFGLTTFYPLVTSCGTQPPALISLGQCSPSDVEFLQTQLHSLPLPENSRFPFDTLVFDQLHDARCRALIDAPDLFIPLQNSALLASAVNVLWAAFVATLAVGAALLPVASVQQGVAKLLWFSVFLPLLFFYSIVEGLLLLTIGANFITPICMHYAPALVPYFSTNVAVAVLLKLQLLILPSVEQMYAFVAVGQNLLDGNMYQQLATWIGAALLKFFQL